MEKRDQGEPAVMFQLMQPKDARYNTEKQHASIDNEGFDFNDKTMRKKKSSPKKEDFHSNEEHDKSIKLLSKIYIKGLSQKESRYDVVHNSRVIVKDILNSFSELPRPTIIKLATRNQAVTFVTEETLIDYSKTSSILNFIESKSYNFSEIDDIILLASGGQSIVYRLDHLQPLELVLKMPIGDQSDQEKNALMECCLYESQIINLLPDKTKIVDILEEVIEYNMTSDEVSNCMVIVEQAINDLKQIVYFWNDEEKMYFNTEFFSNEKLFYFAFKVCEVIDYCHQNHVYYGDIKENNFLIFRDYLVKLGDFGISIKCNPDLDSDEGLYQLKGSSKYTNPFIIQENEAKHLSKNELMANDYYALNKMFEFIYNKCKDIQGNKQTENLNKHDVLLQGFDNNSLFVQLLQDLKQIHPVKFPLECLVNSYREKVQDCQGFFQTICDSLIEDDKTLAIPNILSIWRHHTIPLIITEFFNVQLEAAYPFLTKLQMTNIQEDNFSLDYEEEPLSEQIAIQQIQSYINQVISDKNTHFNTEFASIIQRLVLFSQPFERSRIQNFYEECFSRYYCCKYEDHKVTPNEEYISILNTNSGIFEYDVFTQTVLKDKLIFLLFFAATRSFQFQLEEIQQFIYQIERFKKEIQDISDNGGFLTEFEGKEFYFNAFKQILTYLLNFEISTEKEILLSQLKLEIMESFNFFHIHEKLSDLEIKSAKIKQSNQYDKLYYLEYILRSQNDIKHSLREKQSFILKLKTRQDSGKKQMNQEVGSYLYQKGIVDQINTYHEAEYQNLKLARSILKKSRGELGDLMSNNAYQIYRMLKNKKKGEISHIDHQEALKMLKKACNYSLEMNKPLYLYDLIIECFNEGSKYQARKKAKLLAGKQFDLLYKLIMYDLFLELDQKETNNLRNDLTSFSHFKFLEPYLECNNFKQSWIRLLNMSETYINTSASFIYHTYVYQAVMLKFKRYQELFQTNVDEFAVRILKSGGEIHIEEENAHQKLLPQVIIIKWSDKRILTIKENQWKLQWEDGRSLEYKKNDEYCVWIYKISSAKYWQKRTNKEHPGEDVKIHWDNQRIEGYLDPFEPESCKFKCTTINEDQVYIGTLKYFQYHGFGQFQSKSYENGKELKFIQEGEWRYGRLFKGRTSKYCDSKLEFECNIENYMAQGYCKKAKDGLIYEIEFYQNGILLKTEAQVPNNFEKIEQLYDEFQMKTKQVVFSAYVSKTISCIRFYNSLDQYAEYKIEKESKDFLCFVGYFNDEDREPLNYEKLKCKEFSEIGYQHGWNTFYDAIKHQVQFFQVPEDLRFEKPSHYIHDHPLERMSKSERIQLKGEFYSNGFTCSNYFCQSKVFVFKEDSFSCVRKDCFTDICLSCETLQRIDKRRQIHE